MKRLKTDVPVVDAEQEWINKYRAAISGSPPRPIFKKMVAGFGYLVAMILGTSKKLMAGKGSTPDRTQPQPLEAMGIKSTKKKRRSRKDRVGKFAA
jgi:hypothetical protein